ncbi:hypothetical protein [Dokdonella soli]|uniref:Uncharacterized protein n=1 Tax=Dokdonella soli TaxID=529810 RepID=A0ABP3TST4_9GAMM
MKLPVIAFIVAASLAAPLSAAEKASPAVNADTKEAFATVSEWVHKQMNEGGRYSHVTSREKETVDKRFDEMDKLFAKSGAVAQMSDDEKTRMFNAQEEINAILAKRDSERLICKNVAPVGSHIPVKTCVTAGELENRRREDTHYLDRTQQTNQLRGGGG